MKLYILKILNICTISTDRRAELLDWLNGLLPDFDGPIDSSEEELRKLLYDGTVLCSVLNMLIPGIIEVLSVITWFHLDYEQGFILYTHLGPLGIKFQLIT
jgi:hypothetical protein